MAATALRNQVPRKNLIILVIFQQKKKRKKRVQAGQWLKTVFHVHTDLEQAFKLGHVTGRKISAKQTQN